MNPENRESYPQGRVSVQSCFDEGKVFLIPEVSHHEKV